MATNMKQMMTSAVPRFDVPSFDDKTCKNLGFRDKKQFALAWTTLCNYTFKAAKDPSVILTAFLLCKTQNLDVFSGVYNIVSMKTRDRDGRIVGEQDSIWTTNKYARIMAERTGKFGGFGETHESEDTHEAYGYTVPKWISVDVIKVIDGVSITSAGVRIFAKEFCKGTKVWKAMPYHMLQKTAEKASLSRTFPEIDANPSMSQVDKALGSTGANIDPVAGALYGSEEMEDDTAESLEEDVEEKEDDAELPSIEIPSLPPTPSEPSDPVPDTSKWVEGKDYFETKPLDIPEFEPEGYPEMPKELVRRQDKKEEKPAEEKKKDVDVDIDLEV